MTHATTRAARRANKIEKLGFDAACAHCRETDIVCLQEVINESNALVLCASCRASRQGRRATESHHVMGRHNGNLTVSIPPNDHACLSDYQYDWPKETLRNPSGSPLRIIAALLRGWINLLDLVMQHALGWTDFLETLDIHLANKLGSAWWTEIPSTE